MSRETGKPAGGADATLTARGYRMAFGVTVSLAIEALRGADLPTLAPMIALQLLALSPRPPGAKMVGMLFGAAAASSLAAWVIAAVTVSIPGAYPLGMGVLYLWCFALSLNPKTAPLGAMALTMTIVVGSLSAASTVAAAGIALSLLLSILSGGAMVYLAFALFPPPPAPAAAAKAPPPPPPPASGVERLPLAWRAGLATLVMLPVHMWLTSDGVAAMPVLFTCSAMLRQPGIEASMRDSFDRLAGTAAGGAPNEADAGSAAAPRSESAASAFCRWCTSLRTESRSATVVAPSPAAGKTVNAAAAGGLAVTGAVCIRRTASTTLMPAKATVHSRGISRPQTAVGHLLPVVLWPYSYL